LTELLQKVDEEIGKAAWDVDQKAPGAEGRLAEAEARHSELLARQERRHELERQLSLTLQAVGRWTSVLILPHPEREAPEVRRLQSNAETETTAMRLVMEYEASQGCQVYDIQTKTCATTSLALTSTPVSCGSLRSRALATLPGPCSSQRTNAARPRIGGIVTGSIS
jgi:hypothetical protein